MKQYDKIYVLCPGYNKTGGLELLHQLVYTLNSQNINCIIAYTNVIDSNPINDNYKKYVNSFVTIDEIEDNESNLVIISEHQVELMDRFKKCDISIWWLSVDNYFKVYSLKATYKIFKLKGVLWFIKNKRWKYSLEKIAPRITYNFAQSYYAIDFLKNNNFNNVKYLSDYLNSDYLTDVSKISHARNDVVLYNPKKGKEFTEYLMSLDQNLKWIPLINLTNTEMKKLLLSSKVYVDFGNHPGKDRIPREAVICGCCVITGKKGSAAFYKDVLIADTYKFDDTKENGELVISKIKDCFENYDICIKDFEEYRNMIRKEESKFNEDVKNIFSND